jgi:hypothetical protein
MKHSVPPAPSGGLPSWARAAGHWALAIGLLLPGLALAQAPAWQDAFSNSSNQPGSGSSVARATAVDAQGNVFVAGSFTGQAAFGSTLLVSAGSTDAFVAKWDATTQAWAWAVAGGGTAEDVGFGIAVSEGEVYVSGYVTNSGTAGASTTQQVKFGGAPLYSAGTTGTANLDVFVARYTDGATAPTYRWAAAGGGTGPDISYGIAASGGEVYATGYVTNSGTAGASSSQGVQFGGTPLYSASTMTGQNQDAFVVHYASAGAYRWAVAGGGTGQDIGYGIAASGGEVYVTGSVTNSGTAGASTARAVQFGEVPLYSASTTGVASSDVFVARYTDGATAATYRWAAAGGGTRSDLGNGIAVSGGEIYVTGTVTNSGTAGTSTSQEVQFGGAPLYSASTTGTANSDVFVARYTDGATAPTYRWAAAGGGTGTDVAYALAASGGEVYVTGSVTNSGTAGASTTQQVQFGGAPLYSAGTTGVANLDIFVARYTDGATAPTYRWAAAGGSTGGEAGFGLAVSGSSVVVASNSGPVRGSLGGLVAPPSTALLSQLEAGAGRWQRVATPLHGGQSSVQATAVDAQGNVFVTGSFTGQAGFGSSLLVAAGFDDVFLAKWDATARAWAWAVAGGGTSSDVGRGLAVSGGEIYVTGSVTNSGTAGSSTSQAVQFGSVPLYSASSNSVINADIFVAHYTDGATAPTFRWAVAAGGTGFDVGQALAVSGGEVYVTGYVSNSGTAGASTSQAVQFGGTPLYSASTTGTANNDLFIARYTDGATAATCRWAVAGGGTDFEYGNAIAVSSGEVYVTGRVSNSGTANASTTRAVQFGGVPLYSASTGVENSDVFLVRYTDGDAAPTYRWAVAAGGTGDDEGNGLAVSGGELYMTGSVTNSGTLGTSTDWDVQFGGTPLPSASTTDNQNTDIFVAHYTDGATAPTCRWAVAAGGTDTDIATSLVVRGGEVYVAGHVANSGTAGASTTQQVQFDGTPLYSASTTGTANYDVFVARYTDGATAPAYRWAVAGGGTGYDYGNTLAVSGQQVYVGGQVLAAASFGSSTLANRGSIPLNFLARLTDTYVAPLPVQLTQFTAQASGPAAVRLAWATASEVNSQAFEVERSLDGTSFSKVGEVAAAGSTTAAHTYSLLDAALPAGAGQLYYRLRQVDQDGSAHYSPVRTVAQAAASAGLALYPNPAPGGAATLLGAMPGTTVTVLDALGRSVATAPADASGTATLPGGLPAGVYVVRAGQQALRLTVE